MEAGMAGIGDIVGAAGGGLARVAGGFGEELQAASQTTNTASPRILPFGAFIRISPLANAYGNRGRIVTPIPLTGSPPTSPDIQIRGGSCIFACGGVPMHRRNFVGQCDRSSEICVARTSGRSSGPIS